MNDIMLSKGGSRINTDDTGDKLGFTRCNSCKGTLRTSCRKCGHIVIGLVRVTVVSILAHLSLSLEDLAERSPLCHGYMQGRQYPVPLIGETPPTSLFFLFLFFSSSLSVSLSTLLSLPPIKLPK